MPNVAGVEYPYTPEGIAAAQQAERQIGKMGPFGSDIGRGGGGGWGGLVGDPFMSPGLLELVRQGRQPTFSDVSHRPERPAPAWYGGAGMFGNLTGGVSGPSLVDMVRANTQNPLPQQGGISTLQGILQLKALQEMMGQGQSQAGIADQYQPTGIRPEFGVAQNWLKDAFGNVMTNQSGAPATQQPTGLGGFGQTAAGLRPFESQPTSNFGQLIGQAIRGLPEQMGGLGQAQIPGAMFGQNPWQRPIAQAPRGQTIRTTDPGAGYGSSPSGPTAQKPRQPANYGRSPSNPNWTPGG